MQAIQTQLAVVGASAAGLMAAREAAATGTEVVLLEQREEVGVPPAHANVLLDALWPGEEPLPEGAVRRTYDGLRVLGPQGARLELPLAGHLVDRTRFDKSLAHRAEAAGARLRSGVTISGARPGRLEGEVGVDAEVLLFTDGPDGLALDLLEPLRHPGRMAHAEAFRARAPGIGDERFVDVSVGSHVPLGRSQLNPHEGDEASLWLFHARGTLDVEAARELHARALGLSPDDLFLEKVGEGKEASLCVSGELAGDGVLVAGGAAGQPGIEQGLLAGRLAGRVAGEAVQAGDTSKAALKPYERAWKRDHLALLTSFAWAVERLSRKADPALDRIVRAWEGADVEERMLRRLLAPEGRGRLGGLARLVLANPRATWVLGQELSTAPW